MSRLPPAADAGVLCQPLLQPLHRQLHATVPQSCSGSPILLQVLEATKELIQEANFEVSTAGINLQVSAAGHVAGRVKSNGQPTSLSGGVKQGGTAT